METGNRAFFALFILLSLFWSPRPVAAKDFPAAVAEVDPLAASVSPGVPAGMGGAFEYGNYFASHDDVDSFYLLSSVNPVLFDAGGIFALGGIYEADLLCGPVAAGETQASVAAFWMNAVQFEYGLYASLALPFARRPHLLAEYSRTSQHPLRPQYSQVAADVVMLGIAPAELKLGRVAILTYLRAGYSDLFAFWQSALPRPRISWVFKPGNRGGRTSWGNVRLCRSRLSRNIH